MDKNIYIYINLGGCKSIHTIDRRSSSDISLGRKESPNQPWVSPHDDVNPELSPRWRCLYGISLTPLPSSVAGHSYFFLTFLSTLSLCDPNYLAILFRPSDTNPSPSDLHRHFAPPDFCPQRASLLIRRQAPRLL